MAQILDLSKVYSQEQVEEAKANSNQYEDVEAGVYVCKVIDAILNNNKEKGKQNIELHLDILEGEHKGFFQRLEDRAGFWGLRGYMSFKENQIDRFLKACTAFNNSNANFSFDPMREGGSDVDSLIGKEIGIVIQKEEYRSNSGDIKEKCTVYNILESEKARTKKKSIKIPGTKKLESNAADQYVKTDDNAPEKVPFL